MRSPYKTNCFDYNQIGCKSRSDCIEKCNIELSLNQCHCLPHKSNADRHNDKDNYCCTSCEKSFDYNICEEKYKSPDCINEYYSSLKILHHNSEHFNVTCNSMSLSNQQFNKTEIKQAFVDVVFADEPDTIYRHSPQQHIVEFICFVCSIISLWTGFSVFSTYACGIKTFIMSKNHEN